jgi:hypothetical protein
VSGRSVSTRSTPDRHLAQDAVGQDYQPPLPASMVAAAIARAEGNVLHAVMLHDVLRGLPPEQRRAERIPGGLRHLIGEVWNRAASTESVCVGMGLLCTAQKAPSLDTLAEVPRAYRQLSMKVVGISQIGRARGPSSEYAEGILFH